MTVFPLIIGHLGFTLTEISLTTHLACEKLPHYKWLYWTVCWPNRHMDPWTLGELLRLWTLNSPWLKHVWYRLAPHMENRETIGSLNLLHWSLTCAWSAGLNTWAFLYKQSPSGSTGVYITHPILSRLEWADEILIFHLPRTATRFFKFFRLTLTSWVGYYLLSSITHWGGLMYVFKPNRLMIKITISMAGQTS